MRGWREHCGSGRSGDRYLGSIGLASDSRITDGAESIGTAVGAAATRPASVGASAGGLAGVDGGDIVAVLPRLEPVAVDVVVTHAAVKAYAAEADKERVWSEARAEQTKGFR